MGKKQVVTGKWLQNHRDTEKSWRHGNHGDTELRASVTSVVPWLQGQITIEYFILFAVMAIVTVIGFTSLKKGKGIRADFQGFVNAVAEKIAQ